MPSRLGGQLGQTGPVEPDPEQVLLEPEAGHAGEIHDSPLLIEAHDLADDPFSRRELAELTTVAVVQIEMPPTGRLGTPQEPAIGHDPKIVRRIEVGRARIGTSRFVPSS